MQEDATALEKDREKAIQTRAQQEAAELEAEEKARARSSKQGGKGDFIYGINRRAGELSVEERMRRGKGAFEHDSGIAVS